MKTVKTQAELDAALEAGDEDIVIDSPRGVWMYLYGTATVRAYGTATVRAYGTATVRASGSATVEASGSATVRASGSATVRAYGSATVEAYGSATVEAYGSATVRAYDTATVRAAKYVAVHLFSQRVTHTGGVLIDMTAVDLRDITDWCDLTGTQRDGDQITVYKAVDDELKSGRGFAYPIGTEVADKQWRDDHGCGGGLHFSPTPNLARDHYREATRFLECRVTVSEARPIDRAKLKAPRALVVREVDRWTMQPVEGDKK